MTQPRFEIKSAKLKKDESLTMAYSERSSTGAIIHHPPTEFPDLPEDSFIGAWKAMRIHLGLLSFQINRKTVESALKYSEDAVKDIYFTGIHIKGEKADQTIHLVGWRKLPNDQPLTLNVRCRIANESDNRYEFTDDLAEQVKTICKECILYLEGNFKPNPQTKLDFEGKDKPAVEPGGKVRKMGKKGKTDPGDMEPGKALNS